ncbi:class A beta-lactamase-related serine hydrolase [Pseudonocardiaceae bacterium YIM PH 21723]|nr:class A beta-lactamase-related serine hydrolase [Pseudonocardiaceae bacterium YIM PH 21723]
MDTSKIREVLNRHVDSGKIPGVVALISRGEETYVEAAGTMRHDGGAPMARDTIFRLASTSKPIGVAATMALVEDCRLRLDDPVDEWLPELADRQVLKRPDGPLDETVPARRQITIRDLLTSTFGLGLDVNAFGLPIQAAILEQNLMGYATPPPAPDEWMRRLGTLPLVHHPGEHWQYHLSLDVLGVLVSRVTGQSLDAYLRERIFGPLGMTDTGFHVPADKIHRLPVAYAPDAQTGEFTVWDEAEGGRYSSLPEFQSGGGGLVSTVDDYHAYFRMLLNHGTHGGERILSRPTVELMTTNRMTASEQARMYELADDKANVSLGLGKQGGWGIGMAVRTYRADYNPIGQFGWDGGTGTSAYADPANDVVGFLFTQTGMSTPDAAHLIHDFWTTVYQQLAD